MTAKLAPPLPYGRDYDDTGRWMDRDGTTYDGRGPYERLPWRWARRKVPHHRARGWRR